MGSDSGGIVKKFHPESIAGCFLFPSPRRGVRELKDLTSQRLKKNDYSDNMSIALAVSLYYHSYFQQPVEP